MTAIVGVLCNDGVVIGADSSATFVLGGTQYRTIEQPTEKIEIISDEVILAGTGFTGHNQRFVQIVKEAAKNRLKGDPLAAVKYLTKTAIDDLKYTHATVGAYGAVVAFVGHDKPQLCEFQVSDFQPDPKTKDLWYVSMGSSQTITDPFLGFIREVYWKDGMPSVNDAIFAVKWTLEHAIALNTGGVNGPVRMAILETINKKFKARMVPEDELQEHQQHIDAAKNALIEHRRQLAELGGAEELPSPPAG